MKIFKTWKSNTYLEGQFYLRDRSENWAKPIEFPTVFVAHGRAIKSGNWQSCTAINMPNYVIENYFDTVGNERHDSLFTLWGLCRELSEITWQKFYENEENIKNLIDLANLELNKLKTL